MARLVEDLADQAFFAQVRVDPEIGTVVWPNGVDMATETLYEKACERPVSHTGLEPGAVCPRELHPSSDK
ncbi:MAG: DUF2442 domain-containing protein [Solirubrobacterales bacterium]